MHNSKVKTLLYKEQRSNHNQIKDLGKVLHLFNVYNFPMLQIPVNHRVLIIPCL